MYKDYTGLSMNANLQLNIKMIEEVKVKGTKNNEKGQKKKRCKVGGGGGGGGLTHVYPGPPTSAHWQRRIKMMEEVNVQGTKNIVKGNQMQLCMICVQCMYIL